MTDVKERPNPYLLSWRQTRFADLRGAASAKLTSLADEVRFLSVRHYRISLRQARCYIHNRPYNKNLQRAQVFITYLRAFFLAVAERSLKWYSLTLVLLWPLLLCKVPSAILCELPLCSVPSFL